MATGMVLNKKIGMFYEDFMGSVAALNMFTALKKHYGDAGIGISYPQEIGESVRVAKPGIGEIFIDKVENGYQVHLFRGRLGSLLASAIGKYE